MYSGWKTSPRAPDYLLVPEGKQEVFSKLLRRAVLDFFGPAPLDSPDLPCIILGRSGRRPRRRTPR